MKRKFTCGGRFAYATTTSRQPRDNRTELDAIHMSFVGYTRCVSFFSLSLWLFDIYFWFQFFSLAACILFFHFVVFFFLDFFSTCFCF